MKKIVALLTDCMKAIQMARENMNQELYSITIMNTTGDPDQVGLIWPMLVFFT